MIEARVECLCAEYQLPEFNLVLRKGDVKWLPESSARKSKALALAKRIRAVSVRWEERCQVAKPPPRSPGPPYLRAGVRRPTRVPKAPEPPVPVQTPVVDMEAIARRAETAAANAATKAVDDAVGRLAAMLNQGMSGGGISEAALEAAVFKAMGRAGTAAPRGESFTRVADDEDDDGDEPLYIPSGLVNADLKTDIKVEASTSESASLDDAAAALRATAGGEFQCEHCERSFKSKGGLGRHLRTHSEDS